MQETVFFDKDGTLGRFESSGQGLYPNVEEFLDQQERLGRKLYVITTASEAGRGDLKEVIDKFSGYFGRERIDTVKNNFYQKPNGTIGIIQDDYSPRISLESEGKIRQLDQEAQERRKKIFDILENSPEGDKLRKEARNFREYWYALINRETREPFVATTTYQNPHLQGRHSKDLYLAKRLISPRDYEDLKTVMVGDYGDLTTPISDPHTPLIVISNGVRQGNWQSVSVILERLFSQQIMPWQVYDEIFVEAINDVNPKRDSLKRFELENLEFKLEKGKKSERIIYCP